MTRQLWVRIQEAPYELWLAAASLLFAATALVLPWSPFPASLIDLLGGDPKHPALTGWAAVLGVGGLLTLVGRLRNALAVESAGLALLTGGIGVYALATAFFVPVGWYPSLIQGSLALATGIRLRVIRKAYKAGRPVAWS